MTESLYQQIDEAERRVQESTEMIEKAQHLGAVIEQVEGSAEHESGHVRITYGAKGVQDIELDPRAMRMVSEDLAAALKETIAAAAADYRDRTMDALRDQGLMPDPEQQQRNMEQLQRQLGEATEQFTGSLRTAAARIDEATTLKQNLGR